MAGGNRRLDALEFVKACVCSAVVEQFLMAAHFDDAAAVKNNDSGG